MSFDVVLMQIADLIEENPQKCIMIISGHSFVNLLFSEKLRSFVKLFQQRISRCAEPKSKLCLDSELIIAFYSIAIFRTVAVAMHSLHTVVLSAHQQPESIYNVRLATDTLTKIFRSTDTGQLRAIVTGLLLCLQGFSNYKMIMQDLEPRFVTMQTMDIHAQQMRIQCPKLFEQQMLKHKNTDWCKYLQYQPIELNQYWRLVSSLCDSQSLTPNKLQDQAQTISSQKDYLLRRIALLQTSEQAEKVSLDEFVATYDIISDRLAQRITETMIIERKSNRKHSHITVQNEFDYQQLLHRVYLQCLNGLLAILLALIRALEKSWIRRVKWLYNCVFNTFCNFTVRGSCFHESLGLEYLLLLRNCIGLVKQYYCSLGTGFFPQRKLNEIFFDSQFSIYKLAEAILYNEYDLSQGQTYRLQNYQRAKNPSDAQQKQTVIDVVNINMKTLNLNIHYDSILSKIIPSLRCRIRYVEYLLVDALSLLLAYYKRTTCFYSAAKLIFMLDNAKNTRFLQMQAVQTTISRIRRQLFSRTKAIHSGLELFCEDYFEELMKSQINRNQQQKEAKGRTKRMRLEHMEQIKIHPMSGCSTAELKQIQKTQSLDAHLQGWEQQPQETHGEVIGNELFYSVKDGSCRVFQKEENQVILPEFQ